MNENIWKKDLLKPIKEKHRALQKLVRKTFPDEDFITFNSVLAQNLDKGMSLLDSLKMIVDLLQFHKSRKIVKKLIGSVKNDELTLSEALFQERRYFDFTYLKLVEKGEKNNDLPRILKAVAQYKRDTHVLEEPFTYGVVLFFFLFLIQAGIVTYVLPVFATMFDGMGSKLPPLTQFLINIQPFLKFYSLAILIVYIVLLILNYFSKTDILQLKKIKGYQLNYKLLFLIDLGLNKLIPMELIPDLIPKNELSSVGNQLNRLKEGEKLSEIFKDIPSFDNYVVKLVAMVEEKGSILDIINNLKTYYTVKTENLNRKYNIFLEVGFHLFVSVHVALLVIAAFNPILIMSENVF